MQGIQPKNNNKGKAQMFVIFLLSSLCIACFCLTHYITSTTFPVPCKDFDESADCATMKADGKCELDGKGGEIARFRCFKTCTGC